MNNKNSNKNNGICSSNDLEYLVETIKSSGIDIAPTYYEYTNLAFAIATDYGEAGRWAFHAICSASKKYNDKHADKLYSNAVASNQGVIHIASAFYLARQAGVNIDDVRLKRAEEMLRQRENEQKNTRKNAKMQKCNGIGPYTGARVPYYIGNGSDGDANGGNANINLDDDDFDNLSANEAEPTSESTEPFIPLPMLFDDYRWPNPIAGVLDYAKTRHQRDVLFLGMVDAIGSTLSPYVRTMYGGKWMYPNIQLFVVAPPASGKGVVSLCRNFVAPFHERIRMAYRKEMQAYEKEKRRQEQLGRAKADEVAPELPPNKMFIIPGDNSSTGIAQNVIDSDGRGIIIEAEADTVSAALGADYGRWSHMLRNFFDHSNISYNRRQNREYMETEHTMVSVILAGTPAQVSPLIPSSENGLFSRELFYYMPNIDGWQSQLGDSDFDIPAEMKARGKEWMRVMDDIARLGSVRLKLSASQGTSFDACFSKLFARNLKAKEQGMSASLARLAINIIRIMSVIAVLRRIDEHGVSFVPASHISAENKREGVLSAFEVSISDDDFNACLAMVEPLYMHAAHVSSFIGRNEVKNRNVSDRERLLNMMDDEFSRNKWADAAKEMSIPVNTAYSWLQRMIKSGTVKKTDDKGVYTKR